MTVWIVLGAIVAALVLISLIRVGGTGGRYSRSGTLVHLRAGPLRIQVLPAQAQGKRAGEKRAKQQAKDPQAPKGSSRRNQAGRDSWDTLKAMLPLVADAAGTAAAVRCGWIPRLLLGM